MAEERNVPDEPQEVEQHRDDLELPDETAEEVTGGMAKPDKVALNKLK